MLLPVLLVLLALLAVLLAFVAASGIVVIQEKTNGIVQRMGRFHALASPGLHFIVPVFDRLVAVIPLRIQQLVVDVETKTKDNVFVELNISVQYQVEDAVKSFYELAQPERQIESYVFDVIRARVPLLSVDQLFEAKEELADAVQTELSQTMDDFGYRIIKALVTDIDPAREVKDSMNRINAAERLKLVAHSEAEAEKIRVVKSAEAQAESKRLQGEGIARQRTAIAEGLRQSAVAVQAGMEGVGAKEVMKILLLTQHYDTMEAISRNSNTRTVFVNPSPSGLLGIEQQISQGVMQADAASGEGEIPPSAGEASACPVRPPRAPGQHWSFSGGSS